MFYVRALIFFKLIEIAELHYCSNYFIKPWLHLNDSIIDELNQKDGIKSLNHCQEKLILFFVLIL